MASWSVATFALLEAAVREDVGSGDVTTQLTVPPGLRGAARILTREAGVMAGGTVAAWVFQRIDGELAVEAREDGVALEAGSELLGVSGSVASILTAERLALNFLARLCGIATLTRAFVSSIRGTGARILDTRKTTPGWRELERAAVRAGGGDNHRAGLFDAVLVKENHVHAAGGVALAWRAASGALAGRPVPAFVQIEVRDVRELAEALNAGARRILLDNFSREELTQAVREARAAAPAAVLEASGGVTAANVRSIAETGVDLISIGALTHSARALDLTLLLEGLGSPRMAR
ncbi:MAG: carboxylating nicotinate-nucleotide diphosphorylase [Gemmatimonadetes bacterium]|nr:carboxylating nicotinate-nucleotide diphosphorylase [Gemmatimonadota bacterium]